MSQIRVHQCDHYGEDYGGKFAKELDTNCCTPCFKDGTLNGAKKIYNLKTKQEVSI